MAQLTIKGQIFDINDDPRITVGTPLDEGMVASLQQTRRENIRNNLSKKVEDSLGDNEDLSVEEHSRLQGLVNEYAENYKFGARQAGTPLGHDAFHQSYIRFVELVQQRKLGGVRIVATK